MITICEATTSHLNDLTLLFDVYRIFYEKESVLNGAIEFLKQSHIVNEMLTEFDAEVLPNSVGLIN